MTATATKAPPAPPRETHRLAWLDALRGWAALVVALHHGSYYFTPGLRAEHLTWIDPGTYGVMMFFLVSGYIIPASLERHGSVRRFWISRLFRIYPMLAVACAVGVAPFLLGIRGLRAGLEQHDPLTAVLAHLTMLQDVLAVPNAINVLWTLSYEMVFYLIVVALFVVGWSRRGAVPLTIVLAVATVPAVALPKALFSRTFGIGPVVWGAAALFFVIIVMSASGRSAARLAGGVLGGVAAIVLVLLNGRVVPWQGLAVLAMMFCGTVLARAERRQIGVRVAALTVCTVLVCVVASILWNAPATVRPEQVAGFRIYWTWAVLLAAATFGAAWALRHRPLPGWLTGLGLISFSVYLMHPLLLMLTHQFFGSPAQDTKVGLLFYVAVLLALSCATYRWIERPAQQLGRRITSPT